MIFNNNKAGVPGAQPYAQMPLVFVQALLSLFCTICCCPQEGGTRQFILSTHHTVADGLGPLSQPSSANINTFQKDLGLSSAIILRCFLFKKPVPGQILTKGQLQKSDFLPANTSDYCKHLEVSRKTTFCLSAKISSTASNNDDIKRMITAAQFTHI